MQMLHTSPVADWPIEDSSNFALAGACAVYKTCSSPSNFVITRKVSDELSPDEIDEKDWPEFEKAIKSEGSKMLEQFKGLDMLSLEESEYVRRTHGDRILPSRIHLRWKTEPTDTGVKKIAKSRWLLVGFHDPDVLTLDGAAAPSSGAAAPTPQLTTLSIVLQILASLGFEGHAGDFSTAFLQGDETLILLWVTAPSMCDRSSSVAACSQRSVWECGSATEMASVTSQSLDWTWMGSISN
eukprot:267262-Amphidinium_carterae.1